MSKIGLMMMYKPARDGAYGGSRKLNYWEAAKDQRIGQSLFYLFVKLTRG